MNEEQTSQISENQVEKPKKLGKNFIFLITILVIVLASAGLLLTSQRVSKEIKEQKVEVTILGKYAGWETYVSEKYNYTISYPNDWDILEDASEFTPAIIQPKHFSDRNSVHVPSVALGAGAICEEQDWRDASSNQEFEVKSLCARGDDRVYGIGLQANNEHDKKLTSKIASSFKFNGQITDWETYKSEEIGFKFNYPNYLVINENLEKDVWLDGSDLLTLEINNDELVGTLYVNDGGRGFEDFSVSVKDRTILIDDTSVELHIRDQIEPGLRGTLRAIFGNFEKGDNNYFFIFTYSKDGPDQEGLVEDVLKSFDFFEVAKEDSNESEFVSGSNIVSWDASNIAVSGRIILSINDFPDNVQVSPEAYFGSSDRFKDVKISPDDKWLAVSIGGAAHDFGWLYEISTKKLVPVAFQQGGGVDVKGWINDKEVVFEIKSPKPETREKVVNVNDLPEYPGGL